jgi:hypothetical protein
MFKQIFSVLIAVAGLSGAALAQTSTQQTPPPQTPTEQALAARTCELPKIADTVPLERVAGSSLVVVPVTLNGSPQKFLLDIGIKRPTAVSPDLMAKLGLPQPNPFPTQLAPGAPGADSRNPDHINVRVCDLNSNLGCSPRGDRVRVGAFGIGGATGKHLQFAVAQKGEISRTAPYEGFLTGDFLRKYDAELDFAKLQMTWLTPTNCTDPDQVVFWGHSDVAIIPISLAKDGRMQMAAMVGGHPINAEIDTSSARTVMRRDIAELYVGLKPGTAEMAPEGDLKDGMHMQIYTHTFPQIIFAGGGVTALNVPVLIQNFSMRPSLSREQHIRGALVPNERIPDLSIGMDVLQHLHLYVVPGQGKIYLTAYE